MTLDHPSLSELRPEGEHLPNGDHSASRSAPAPLAQPLLSTLCDLYELLGQAHPRLSGFENVNVSARRVRMGHVLFHEGANASHIHFVRVGAFKCVQTAEDGYEQVLSFSFKGETLGFDALGNGHHPCSALALEDSTVLSVPAQEVLDPDGLRAYSLITRGLIEPHAERHAQHVPRGAALRAAAQNGHVARAQAAP
jgi:CRP-like cAMP-binding protein